MNLRGEQSTPLCCSGAISYPGVWISYPGAGAVENEFKQHCGFAK